MDQARVDVRSRGLSMLGCRTGLGACKTGGPVGFARVREVEWALVGSGVNPSSRSSMGYRGAGGTETEMTPLGVMVAVDDLG